MTLSSIVIFSICKIIAFQGRYLNETSTLFGIFTEKALSATWLCFLEMEIFKKERKKRRIFVYINALSVKLHSFLSLPVGVIDCIFLLEIPYSTV